jgi:uncharacterized membrane protein YozB (DUF420 family)
MATADKVREYSAEASDQFDALNLIVRERRGKLGAHSVYQNIVDRESMRTFMESHVFAVWDFMSLLKALQRGLTCVDVPWVPVGSAESRALINGIVAEEESDVDGDGRHLSHLELYIDAMEESGADTQSIHRLIDALRSGASVAEALAASGAPEPALAFSTATMEMVERGDLVEIAASFTLAREAIIPTMFRPLIRRVDTDEGVKSPKLRYYFDRHIELDGGEHGEMAKGLLCSLCGDSIADWRKATDAAISALEARRVLWDGIEKAIIVELSEPDRKTAERNRDQYLGTRFRDVPDEEAVRRRDGFAKRIIYILSAVICGAVAFLILGPRPENLAGQLDVSALPFVNMSLNLTAAFLLMTAFWLIKRGDVERHKKVMLGAFGVSAAFLVSYVIYHWFKAGPRPYTGDFRGLYLFILGSHILLSMSVLPLALLALYRGWNMQVTRHRSVARIAFPVWMYVSVTGVAIYALLY